MKNRKQILSVSIFALVAVVLALFATSLGGREKSVVILSTNDIHSQIDKFPALATAIEMCRDTAEVVLVDAGDRFTGNAYVDLVEYHTPIYELFNSVGYDLVIYGNHEFDKGNAYLAKANEQAQFEILGANIKSNTQQFPQPPAFTIIEREGIKIGFVGVVSNYDVNNHPAGKDESYEGLTFADPQQTAAQYAYLKEEGCDLLILVTHMGLDRDREFLNSELAEGYDMVIGGHSHDLVNEVIGGRHLTQTGNKLKNIGVAVVRKSDGKSSIVSTSNISLSLYDPKPETEAMVERYHQNEQLNAAIGVATQDFTSAGLNNLFTKSISQATKSQIGVYNSGGVRLDKIAAGDISIATILNMEPFSSRVVTCRMTPAQMKKLIMTKFNDKVNVGEAHCIDINFSVPYTVVTGEDGDAVDVLFPTLNDDKSYSVAMGDYIYKTYKGLECSGAKMQELLVAKVIEDYVRKSGELKPDNGEKQSVVAQEVE